MTIDDTQPMLVINPDSPRLFRVISTIGTYGVIDEYPLECKAQSGKITVWYSALRATDGILAFVTCIPREILPDGEIASCDGRVYPIAAGESPVRVDSSVVRDIVLDDDNLVISDHNGTRYSGKLVHVHNPRH